MSGILDRLRDMIFDLDPIDGDMIDPESIEEEVSIETQQEYEEEIMSESRERNRPTTTKSNKVVAMEKPNLTAMNGGGSIKMVLFQPLSYEDSQAIVDNLRANKPVIVNMVDLERECAQRVLDFMAGAVYALNGTIRRVSYGIFVIVPSSIVIVGQGDEESHMFRS